MSVSFRMTISEELAELIEQRRGVLSVQEFTLLALLDRCNGSAVEYELRQQVQQLMQLLGDMRAAGREQAASDEPSATSNEAGGAGLVGQGSAGDDRLGWG